ncbi:hypothetical protein LXL04_020523 [Taraxacum kok-saghyz]
MVRRSKRRNTGPGAGTPPVFDTEAFESLIAKRVVAAIALYNSQRPDRSDRGGGTPSPQIAPYLFFSLTITSLCHRPSSTAHRRCQPPPTAARHRQRFYATRVTNLEDLQAMEDVSAKSWFGGVTVGPGPGSGIPPVFDIKALEALIAERVAAAISLYESQRPESGNGHVQTIDITAANSMSWDELKTMMVEEYCPRSEVQNLEQEFWNLTIKGSEVKAYTTRFTELAILCSGMVTQ